MAPSQEEWDALAPAERAAVIAALPGEVTDAEMSPPEELISRLERLLADTQQRAEQEASRAEQEAKRASAAEAELARMRDELTKRTR